MQRILAFYRLIFPFIFLLNYSRYLLHFQTEDLIQNQLTVLGLEQQLGL